MSIDITDHNNGSKCPNEYTRLCLSDAQIKMFDEQKKEFQVALTFAYTVNKGNGLNTLNIRPSSTLDLFEVTNRHYSFVVALFCSTLVDIAMKVIENLLSALTNPLNLHHW